MAAIPSPPSHKSAMAWHVELLYRVKPWTDGEIAQACGITVANLRVLRHRYLPRQFVLGRTAAGEETRTLQGTGIAYDWTPPDEVPTYEAQLLWVCEKFAVLAESQQAQINDLLAQRQELEHLILAERAKQMVTV